MELLTPNIGLIFWTLIIFVSVFFALKQFALPTILNTVQKRENEIAEALAIADQIKKQLIIAKQEHEAFLASAQQEKEMMIREANDAGAQIILKAKSETTIKCEVALNKAIRAIQIQKGESLNQALTEVESIAMEASEKLLHRKVSEKILSEGAE